MQFQNKILKNTNIIITGSNGQLGKFFYNYLKKNNNILIVNHNENNNKKELNYSKINFKIIKNFDPDYFFHFGSPTDKKKNDVFIYKKWLRDSKKIFNLFSKIKKKNYFINVGSIKELMNPDNFNYNKIKKNFDLYSMYKYKFSTFLNKKNLDNTIIHNIYLTPVYGEYINSGIVYQSCIAIINNKRFEIQSKNSIRSFLYINDLFTGLNNIMLNKHKKINNTIFTSNEYKSIEQLMTKQFKVNKNIHNLILKDDNIDKFRDMSKLIFTKYNTYKLINYTKFNKGYNKTLKWLKENE